MRRRIGRWWERLTPAQAVLGLGVLVGLYLIRDSIPTDPDTWKEWLRIGGEVLVLGGALGSVLHGREIPARIPRTDPPENER